MKAAVAEFSPAIQVAQKAKKEFIRLQDKRGEARAWQLLSKIKTLKAGMIRNEGEKGRLLAEAADDLECMKDCARELKDGLLEATAYGSLEHMYMEFGPRDEAIKAAREAVRLAKRHGSVADRIEFFLSASDTHMKGLNDLRQQDHTYATKFAQEALHLADRMRNKKHRGNAHLRLVNCYAAEEEAERAMSSSKAALEAFTDIGNHPLRARAMAYIAHSHEMAGRKDQAEDAARASMELSAKHPGIWDADVAVMVAKDTLKLVLGEEAFEKEFPTPKHEDEEMYIDEEAVNEEVPVQGHELVPAVAKPRGFVDTVRNEILDMARISLNSPDLTVDSPLEEFGMDSISAVSFRNGVRESLGFKVSTDVILEHPTVRLIVERIREETHRF